MGGPHEDMIPCLRGFIYFIYFYSWLCWVFTAAHRLTLVAASGGSSLVAVQGLLAAVAALAGHWF